VTVTRNRHGPRPRIALLYHNLMSDSSSSRIEIHALLLGKLLNLPILFQVCLALVLDVVIEGHNDLLGIVDLGGSDGHELQGDWPRVVMCHAVEGRERDIVAGFHDLAVCEAERITLNDFFRESLWGFGWCSQGGEDCRGIGIFSLRMEHILESLCRRCEGPEA
jgi:hypothetical protein